MNYISKTYFQNSSYYTKINKHIDTCLCLLERLISYNSKCKDEVAQKLNVENYIVDYRIDQFNLYENILRSIYYSCYSLKNIFDISTFMRYRGLENTFGDTLNNQVSYITFNAIVRLSSIFEHSRKEYDESIPSGNYFRNMKSVYGEKVYYLELLGEFRNTIHRNAKWFPKKKGNTLKYNLRSGEQVLKQGDLFVYDHWFLYIMIKNCIELNKSMALENNAKKIRGSNLKLSGKEIAFFQTNLNSEIITEMFKNTYDAPIE